MGAQAPTRTFWWDRARPVDAEVHPLRAVIFDADTALADIERSDDDLAPKAGLTDLVMSLFVAGIWVAVVSTRDRDCTQTLVRQVIGEGLVETIVSGDDLDQPGCDVELYRLALWELGIAPESALAIGGSDRGLRVASTAGLPTVLVTNGYAAGHQFTDAAAVRSGYTGGEPLSAAGCRQLHRRWWIQQRRSQAA
ncbi:MAG: HAD family hydrolase [Mycobacterium sp.]|nr:HAD family hydrolase [Mycobacterium sp.]